MYRTSQKNWPKRGWIKKGSNGYQKGIRRVSEGVQKHAFSSPRNLLSRRLRDSVFLTFFSATGFGPFVHMLLAPLRRVFSMKDELQQIFDSVPEDAPRSRLEPYRELILRWRRQGRTYRRICRLLNDRCKVKVAYGPLYRFVQRRSRPRYLHPEAELQPATIPPTPPDHADIRLIFYSLRWKIAVTH